MFNLHMELVRTEVSYCEDPTNVTILTIKTNRKIQTRKVHTVVVLLKMVLVLQKKRFLSNRRDKSSWDVINIRH